MAEAVEAEEAPEAEGVDVHLVAEAEEDVPLEEEGIEEIAVERKVKDAEIQEDEALEAVAEEEAVEEVSVEEAQEEVLVAAVADEDDNCSISINQLIII